MGPSQKPPAPLTSDGAAGFEGTHPPGKGVKVKIERTLPRKRGMEDKDVEMRRLCEKLFQTIPIKSEGTPTSFGFGLTNQATNIVRLLEDKKVWELRLIKEDLLHIPERVATCRKCDARGMQPQGYAHFYCKHCHTRESFGSFCITQTGCRCPSQIWPLKSDQF
jgi:hypothetical protein